MHEPPFRFCPVCSGALEPRLLKASEPERLVCQQCGFVFYLDPKVAVATVVVDDEGRTGLGSWPRIAEIPKNLVSFPAAGLGSRTIT